MAAKLAIDPNACHVKTAKTKTVNALSGPPVLQIRLNMADHTALIFCCKRGQLGLMLVADSALFFKGHLRVITFQTILLWNLFMGVVTLDAVLITFKV